MPDHSAPDDYARPAALLWQTRDFTLLWGGQTISTLGTSVSDIAFGMLVLAVTHSPAQVAFVAGARALPFFLLTLPAGALMDLVDRKRVMLLSDLGRALCLASVAVAVMLGHLTLTQIYIVAVAEGAGATLYNIAALASMPRVVPKEQLGRATSLSYMSSNIVSLAGPPLGSLLFALNAAMPFVVDAASYVGSVISLVWIRVAFQGYRVADGKHQLQALFASLVMGFRWMWRQQVLRFQALAGCVLSMALYPTTALVLAVAGRIHLPTASIGIVFAAGASGGLAGGLLGHWVQRKAPFGAIMSAMFGALGALFAGYMAASNLLWLAALMAAISLVESIGSIANLTYRLALTPDDYQGRINSIHRFVGYGVGRPLGALLLGILLKQSGVTATIWVFSSMLAFMALATIAYAPVRTAPRLG